MSSIPSAKGIDSTLALLRNPYGFIPDTCRDLEGDLFETRILFQKTICMTGAAAAEVFYSEDGLVRAGSMPKRIQRTLLGEKGIQGLDGEAHRHRKRMFMSLMASERIEALENTTRDLLDRYARDWQAAEKVVLYDEVREILTRAACAWSGVPLPEAEVETRTAQMTALFQDAGAVGWKHWGARLARHRAERWIAGIIERVRDGSLQTGQESAAHVVATWRDLNGELLTSKVAAVELLNVVRPIVAVSAFIAQAAHALHRHPEWRQKLTRLVAPGASGADRSQWNRVCRISGSTVKRSSRDWSFSAERPDIRAASARRRAITRPAKPIRSIVSGAGSNTFRSRSVVTIAWAIEWPLSVAVAVSTADSKAARRSCAVAVRFPK